MFLKDRCELLIYLGQCPEVSADTKRLGVSDLQQFVETYQCRLGDTESPMHDFCYILLRSIEHVCSGSVVSGLWFQVVDRQVQRVG